MRSTRHYHPARHLHVRPEVNLWNPWTNWARGIISLPPSTDERALLENAKIPPAQEVHRLHQVEAIKLIEQSVKGLKLGIHGAPTVAAGSRSDFPFLIFNEIDAALFSGLLKGNVYLKWVGQDLAPGLVGRTFRAGRESCPRITIELSEELRQNYCSPQLVLLALVHQMIHAYLLQCCGHKNRNVDGNGHDLAHGLEYSTIAYIIQKHIVVPRQMSYCPAYFGCGGICAYSRVHPRTSTRQILLPYGTPTGESGSSLCRASDRSGITQNEAKDHYEYVKRNTMAPKLDLPSRSSEGRKEWPTSQYVLVLSHDKDYTPVLRSKLDIGGPSIEIHFQNQAYLAAGSSFAHLPSLVDNSSSKTVLKVPGDDKSTWQKLISFIMTGNYKPSTEERHGTERGSGKSHGPQILEYKAEDDPFLLADIKVYRLAMTIDLPELKKQALRRLREQTWTTEDPCTALEYIYHSGPAKTKAILDNGKKSGSMDKDKQPEFKPADSQIREFVRDWLKVKSDSSRHANNLEILQKHPLWAEKYKKLRERGSELITDIDTVEVELRKEQELREEEKKKLKKKRLQAIQELLYPKYLMNRPGYSNYYIPDEHGLHTPPLPYESGYDYAHHEQLLGSSAKDESGITYDTSHFPFGLNREALEQYLLEQEEQGR